MLASGDQVTNSTNVPLESHHNQSSLEHGRVSRCKSMVNLGFSHPARFQSLIRTKCLCWWLLAKNERIVSGVCSKNDEHQVGEFCDNRRADDPMRQLGKTDESLLLRVVIFLLISDVPSLIALLVQRTVLFDDDHESYLRAVFYSPANINQVTEDNHERAESDRLRICVDPAVDWWRWFSLGRRVEIGESLERETRYSRARESDR